MLSPQPMSHLGLVVMSADLEALTRAIAAIGVLHLLDVRHTAGALPAFRHFDEHDRLARLQAAEASLDAARHLLGSGDAPAPWALEDDGIELNDVEARVARIAAAAESLRQRRAGLEDDLARRKQLAGSLKALAPLGFDLEELPRLRYVHLTTGRLPVRNLPRLKETLAAISAVLLPVSAGPGEQRCLVSALCARGDRETLDRALRAAQFDDLDVPADVRGTPDEALAALDVQLEATAEALAALDAERSELAAQLGPELARLRGTLARQRLMAEARGLMGHAERTALITGWVPTEMRARLEAGVRAVAGGRCVLHWTEPRDVDGVRRGRIAVPILLRNPVLVRPFEQLLRGYGLPAYGDIEPTAVVALGFLTMFGFMFGDVGHGAALFAIGYAVYRRMFRYRDYAVILMECGVFATVFGFLYGSVFGVEHWLPALWLRPMEDMERLIRTALAFGVGFLSLGLCLNLINALRRGDTSALWERRGLLAALAYWTAAGLFLRRLTAGPGTVSGQAAALWLAVPLSAIFLAGPLRLYRRSRREGRRPPAGEWFGAAIESAVEVLDTVIAAISNTATFIRLAAFALSHAGLFLATFSVAAVIDRAGGGSIGALLVLVAGNLVILALEGMIVCIQSIRLEYYEFFSQFYAGGGQEYRPLRFAPGGTSPTTGGERRSHGLADRRFAGHGDTRAAA